MKPRGHLTAILAGLALAMPAHADLVVIAHPKSGIEQLTHEQVVNIFLGRFRQYPSGVTAEPIDQPPDSAEKAAFYQKLVNKELAEINAYWARLVFSGRTLPPRQAANAGEVLELVASSLGAIGYVERPKGESKVKIVFELGR